MADQSSGRDGLGSAALLLTLGLILSLAAWWNFREHERAEVQQATRRAAESIRLELVDHLGFQIIGLDRLALLWKAASPARPLWTKNAELYIQHRPGCVAVEWLSLDLKQATVVSSGATQRPLAFNGVPRQLIAAVTTSGVPMLDASAQSSAGGRQWVIAYPVFADGRLRGFILSFFSLEESLTYILGDLRNLGFSFGVTLPHQAQYVLPQTTRKYEQEWGTMVDVAVPGMTWQLRVWPNSDIVNEIRSLLPELILTIGVCLSLLLALAVHFSVRLSHSAQRAQHANEALQQEIRSRVGAQEELRKAHADLEMRIDQRTAELASSNTLLQREVTEHQHAEDILRDLTGRLFQLQDDERKRLARELHDGATQNLVALSLDVGMIRDAIPAGDSRSVELVDECVRLSEEAIRELRTVSYLLHPPYFDELGLVAALRDFVGGFATRSGIDMRLDLDPKIGRLGNQLELGIFRVVQEALSNIHRHAHSRTATVQLTHNAEFIHLEITDAGCGIPPEILNGSGSRLAGVGIAGMQERIRLLGGRLEIQSSNAGTRIHAVIPLQLSNPAMTKFGAVPAHAVMDAGSISAA